MNVVVKFYLFVEEIYVEWVTKITANDDNWSWIHLENILGKIELDAVDQILESRQRADEALFSVCWKH